MSMAESWGGSMGGMSEGTGSKSKKEHWWDIKTTSDGYSRQNPREVHHSRSEIPHAIQWTYRREVLKALFSKHPFVGRRKAALEHDVIWYTRAKQGQVEETHFTHEGVERSGVGYVTELDIIKGLLWKARIAVTAGAVLAASGFVAGRQSVETTSSAHNVLVGNAVDVNPALTLKGQKATYVCQSVGVAALRANEGLDMATRNANESTGVVTELSVAESSDFLQAVTSAANAKPATGIYAENPYHPGDNRAVVYLNCGVANASSLASK